MDSLGKKEQIEIRGNNGVENSGMIDLKSGTILGLLCS